eukprot:g227.t1
MRSLLVRHLSVECHFLGDECHLHVHFQLSKLSSILKRALKVFSSRVLDIFFGAGLTVGEQIRFSADLRNPKEMPASRRKLIYEDVLEVMQLSSIQNSIVGGLEKRGISGGQRKRVSIGLELAADSRSMLRWSCCDPTMLFLDEPTSGLDAASSLSIVYSLKKLTQLGLTSVMVVHQPRWALFSLFDDVLLLGKGGRTVYSGPSQSAKKYFQQLGFEAPESENPADWIMDIIAREAQVRGRGTWVWVARPLSPNTSRHT